MVALPPDVGDSVCGDVVGTGVVLVGAGVVLVGAVVDRLWVFAPPVFVWVGAKFDGLP
jgi:hypothetical protein